MMSPIVEPVLIDLLPRRRQPWPGTLHPAGPEGRQRLSFAFVQTPYRRGRSQPLLVQLQAGRRGRVDLLLSRIGRPFAGGPYKWLGGARFRLVVEFDYAGRAAIRGREARTAISTLRPTTAR